MAISFASWAEVAAESVKKAQVDDVKDDDRCSESPNPCPRCGKPSHVGILKLADDLEGIDLAMEFMNDIYKTGYVRAFKDASKRIRECVGDASVRPRDAAGAPKTCDRQSECGECASDAPAASGTLELANVTDIHALLTDEERGALEWMREHGGLAQVEMDYAMGEGFAELVDGIARRLGLCTDGLDAQDSEPLLMDAIDRRLMPDCLEWPRYEDGSPVRFGDEFANAKGNASTLRTLAIKDGRDLLGGDYFWKLGKGASAVALRNGERVKRPAPPVLAADGEPLKVGQTVWHVTAGHEYIVRKCTNCGAHLSRDGRPAGYCMAEYLTHQRPVLDADGVPIELGDDLYSVEGGLKLHVSNIDKVNCMIATSEMFALDRWADPSMFTHTKPEIDSWERIEEDKDLNPFDYCKKVGHKLWTFDNAEEFKASDLVRRAKKLAGVDNATAQTSRSTRMALTTTAASATG